MSTLCFHYEKFNDDLEKAYKLICRHAGLYTILNNDSTNADYQIELSFDSSFEKEEYEIHTGDDTMIRITGGSFSGLCYGIGKLLHRSPEKLKSERRVPDKEVRGVYFATHFYNYYQAAPIEKVKDYIEELLLWGCNSIAVWFDCHAFSGFRDPEAKHMIERLRIIFKTAKECGMKTTLGTLANEHFYGAPKKYLAENSTDGTGYRYPLCGFYHTELCPSNPDARKLLLKTHREVIEKFADIGLDYVWLWPYDQGGCTCRDCRPWGYRGFLDISTELGTMINKVSPETKLALSTWRFDAFTDGEWNGFLTRFDEVSDRFAHLMIDFRSSAVPEALYSKCDMAGISLWGFPEISMLSAVPWGGFGATPVPSALFAEYKQNKDRHNGGMLYSEGIFEDINKAVMLSLYMGETDCDDVILDYCRYYFGESSLSDMTHLIALLEKSLPRHRLNDRGEFDDYPRDDSVSILPRFVLNSPETCTAALTIADRIKQSLDPKIVESDRFRLLYLRAVIDAELAENHGNLTDTIEDAAQKLLRISFADKADYAVSPITKDAIYKNRGHI